VRDLPFLGPSPALALRFAPVLGTRHMIGEIVMTARRSVGGVETVEDVVGFVVRRKVLCVCVYGCSDEGSIIKILILFL